MDISLPNHLAERCRWMRAPGGTDHAPGEFVVYWMHNALRGHENPALDAAICLARQNGLPLLVYHGLSEQYPFASDRHHAFMLQGHRDVQRELADRGISAAFHLHRQGSRGPYLKALSRAAAVLVTEEMPIEPVTGWMERLAATSATPIAVVDSSCLAPVTSFSKAPENAFQFRRQARAIQQKQIQTAYVEQDVNVAMCDIDSMKDSLGLDPLCLQDADLASLIGQCRIDHTIAPVADSPGGSRAGYARWSEFLEQCIEGYANARNQPTQAQGASRMSPYLHYGMVSPFRLARETAEVAETSEGAKKYLDELITWRDLSFHFCYHNHDTLDTLEAIPKWAQTTLDQHIDDPREDNCSWETLARAQTGRPFWDAAQQSLLRHGQLHNNIRMTWGKAIIPWLQTPRRALQVTLDLNHRYSLDGRDPCSYGGVLWCYGQFDQPADDESPVFGQIRNHDQDEHAKRIDFAKFKEIVGRPIAKRLPRIAVVGAGMAGLTAARTLADHGIDVTVFDKSRALGGRMSTRRAADESTNSLAKPLRFDHGAQYFTARDCRFSRLVNSWIHDGIVEPWMGKIVHLSNQGKILEQKGGTPRYVAVPGMDALAKHLATGLTLQLGTPIVRMRRMASRWEIENAEGQKHGPFDIVLVSCPPAQTSKLIGDHTVLVQQVNQVQMLPCWAMMVADESLAGIPYDGAFVDEHLISWIAHNSGKPGRPSTPAWVVHASSNWSQEHIEDDPDVVQTEMKHAFEALVGKTIPAQKCLSVHRWRHAIASNPVDQHSLFDRTAGIGCCGDWCGGSRVEAAYLSGCSMAGDVLRHYTIDRPAYDSGQSSQLSLFA